jgi:hypothetical protein
MWLYSFNMRMNAMYVGVMQLVVYIYIYYELVVYNITNRYSCMCVE